MYRKETELWNGGTIDILVENRYTDSGEILIRYYDDVEASTASLTLTNLIEFRNNIDEVIGMLKQLK